MAITRRHISVSSQRVFAVLADSGAYGDWVVGSDKVRDADPQWPAVGSRFRHRVGVGLLKLHDHTEVIEVVPGRQLVLRAKARPFGTARVIMRLEPEGDGTLVTMEETGGDPLSRLALNRFTDWLVDLRNRESLRRLQRIAESGAVNAY